MKRTAPRKSLAPVAGTIFGGIYTRESVSLEFIFGEFLAAAVGGTPCLQQVLFAILCGERQQLEHRSRALCVLCERAEDLLNLAPLRPTAREVELIGQLAHLDFCGQASVRAYKLNGRHMAAVRTMLLLCARRARTDASLLKPSGERQRSERGGCASSRQARSRLSCNEAEYQLLRRAALDLEHEIPDEPPRPHVDFVIMRCALRT